MFQRNNTLGRNSPCSCGSGKKFKKCCDAKAYAPPIQAVRVENHDRSNEIVRHEHEALSQVATVQLIELFNAGRFVELESHTRALAQRYPNSEFVRKALGVSLQQQGKYALAVLELQKSIELMPNDAEAHHNLAICLKHLGRLGITHITFGVILKVDFILYQPDGQHLGLEAG